MSSLVVRMLLLRGPCLVVREVPAAGNGVPASSGPVAGARSVDARLDADSKGLTVLAGDLKTDDALGLGGGRSTLNRARLGAGWSPLCKDKRCFRYGAGVQFKPLSMLLSEVLRMV